MFAHCCSTEKPGFPSLWEHMPSSKKPVEELMALREKGMCD